MADVGNLLRENYIFIGWKSSIDGTIYGKDQTFAMPKEDVILTAQWKSIVHTVTFDSKGGNTVAPYKDVLHNSTVLQPANPTKKNLNFKGQWYLKDGTVWKFSTTKVTTDVTLYANWTATVKFDSNGGSKVSSITVDEGSKITKTVPTRKGYTFKGWYIDESLKKEWNFKNGVTGHMTLHAKWKENSEGEDVTTRDPANPDEIETDEDGNIIINGTTAPHDKDKETTQGNGGGDDGTPTTGDTSPVFIIVIAAVACGALIILLLVGKNKKDEK